MKLALFIFCLFGLLLNPATSNVAAAPAGKAKHVVVMVWDGLRPDSITPETTPTLCQLARAGAVFQNHHSVFLSSTEVNGAALATGAYPDHNGIIANREYRPEINWQESTAMEGIDTLRRGDALTSGHYLTVPTMAEMIQRAGYPTAVAGTKPVAILQDRSNRRTSAASRQSLMLYSGRTIPSSALKSIVQMTGRDFPTNTLPGFRDRWTTEAITRVAWSNGVPKLSLLWLIEPDSAQHSKSPAAPTVKAALASNDLHLSLILKTLEEKGVRDKTDVIVVSDHGFSTVDRGVDLVDVLKKAQFKATRKLEDAEPGEVLVVGLGGASMLYVVNHDVAITRRLVQFLQQSNFAGVIFSRVPLPGTFSLKQARLESRHAAPDVVVSFRWKNGTNEFGAAGLLNTDSGKKGTGAHGSLSRYDMHNVLVAAGPDFRRGFVDEWPSGTADVAPTVLWVLGLNPPATMDGRVLREALTEARPTTRQPKQKMLEAAADFDAGRWQQYLKCTTLGTQVYFDEGNGEYLPK
jgi:predicted AlkP superfamily pyrophosphatase or phosphodiesterase